MFLPHCLHSPCKRKAGRIKHYVTIICRRASSHSTRVTLARESAIELCNSNNLFVNLTYRQTLRVVTSTMTWTLLCWHMRCNPGKIWNQIFINIIFFLCAKSPIIWPIHCELSRAISQNAAMSYALTLLDSFFCVGSFWWISWTGLEQSFSNRTESNWADSSKNLKYY